MPDPVLLSGWMDSVPIRDISGGSGAFANRRTPAFSGL